MINKNINYKTILTAGVLILLSVWIAYNAITEYKNETQNLNMTENKSQTITMDQRAMHPDEMKIIDSIVAKFPELKDFPSNTLPPKSIWIEKVDKGTAVAFVVEGSGVNFVGARCFDVGNERSLSETGTYDPRRDGHNNLPYFSPRFCKPVDDFTGNIYVGYKTQDLSPTAPNVLMSKGSYGSFYNSKTDVKLLVYPTDTDAVVFQILDQAKDTKGNPSTLEIKSKPTVFKNDSAHIEFDATPSSAENTKQPVEKDWKPCSATITIKNKDLIHIEVDNEKACSWIANTVLSGNYSTYGD